MRRKSRDWPTRLGERCGKVEYSRGNDGVVQAVTFAYLVY